jgi:hypothetical protein
MEGFVGNDDDGRKKIDFGDNLRFIFASDEEEFVGLEQLSNELAALEAQLKPFPPNAIPVEEELMKAIRSVRLFADEDYGGQK